MRFIGNAFLFIVLICFFYGCKKEPKSSGLLVVMEYETYRESYKKSYLHIKQDPTPILKNYTYSSQHNALTPDGIVSPDSMVLCFSSELNDGDEHCQLYLTICGTFSKAQLDSFPWAIKNDIDFYNLFQPGKLNISHWSLSGFNPNGIDIQFRDKATSTSGSRRHYVFQDHDNFIVPYPAYMDTSNYAEIVDLVYDDGGQHGIDWLEFFRSNSTPKRKALVTINFQCKLYDIEAPYDTIVLRKGIFQGVFVDPF